jgi:hypothetical protein
VGVGQLVEELEQRGARLPFEIGAFVALEACEGLLQQSARIEPDDVRVTLDGSVVLAQSAASAEPDEAARSLVSVLARLLVAAGPGVPPYLLQLVKESTTGQAPRGLKDLHDAIEASLIPMNRGASRRVLARLVRESDRPPAPETPEVDPDTLDAELDELLRDPILRTEGLEPEKAELPPQKPEDEEPVTERIRIPRAIHGAATDTAAATDAATAADTATVPKSFPPPVPDRAPPSAGPLAAAAEVRRTAPEPITATIRKWQPAEEEEEPAAEPEPATESTSVPVAATVTLTDAEPETPTESVFSTGSVSSSDSLPIPEPLASREAAPPPSSSPDRSSIAQALPRRRGGWGIWLLVAALGLGLFGLFAAGVFETFLRTAVPPPEPAPGGVIDASVTPPDAQIFVFIGRGPAIAHDLALGRAHEFVVFDQGLRPSRAVVPADAQWGATDDGPMYELAVQAPRAEAPDEAVDLGVPESNPAESAAEKTGTIRVITNPPSAKVYRYVGTGPSVRIPVSSIHEGQEVLVYHPNHETRRAVIGPSDWKRGPEDGSYGAELTVRLPSIPASPVAEPVED